MHWKIALCSLSIGHQHRAAAARGVDQQRARHHQRFLVRDQHVLAGARRRERRRQSGRADDGGHHDVDVGTGRDGVRAHRVRTALRVGQLAARRSCSSARGGRWLLQHRDRRPESQALLEQRRVIGGGRSAVTA